MRDGGETRDGQGARAADHVKDRIGERCENGESSGKELRGLRGMSLKVLKERPISILFIVGIAFCFGPNCIYACLLICFR
jgi:hypothetical protein